MDDAKDPLTSSRVTFSADSFSRETPSRFRKELVKSIESAEGFIPKDSLNQVLMNIGRQDRLLTEEEYQVLCKAANGGDDTAVVLSASNMMKLF